MIIYRLSLKISLMVDRSMILVTGGSGQLGRKLVVRLIESGYKVRAHYRSRVKADRWCPAKAEAVFGDLLEPSWLEKATTDCRYVVHCAAKVSLRPMAIEPMRSINVEGTRAVIRACRKAAVKRLVHVSSTAAVGGSKGEMLDETAEFNLAGSGIPYFECKRESELLVLQANSDDFETVVVNPSIMISPPDRRLEPSDKKRFPKFLPFYFDFGINVVDTRDVVDGIILAFEKGRPGERYILGGENIDANKLFELTKKYLDIKKPRLKVPLFLLFLAGALWEAATFYKDRKPPLNRAIVRLARSRFYYDSSKAKNELGWQPRPLEQSIKEILEAIDYGIDS